MRLDDLIERLRKLAVRSERGLIPALRPLVGKRWAFIHFADSPGDVLQVNPKANHYQPMGIYGYLITQHLIEVLEGRVMSSAYAQDRHRVHIFEAKSPDKVLDISTYTMGQWTRDNRKLPGWQEALRTAMERTEKTTSETGVHDLLLDHYKRVFPRDSAAFALMTATKMLSKQSEARWSLLFQRMGYQGLVDSDGIGALDHTRDGATQGVMFQRAFIRDDTHRLFENDTATNRLRTKYPDIFRLVEEYRLSHRGLDRLNLAIEEKLSRISNIMERDWLLRQLPGSVKTALNRHRKDLRKGPLAS